MLTVHILERPFSFAAISDLRPQEILPLTRFSEIIHFKTLLTWTDPRKMNGY